MNVTPLPVAGYERVERAEDPATGLVAFISVHSTALGPGLGGMRLWPYASEEAALVDVLRLSRGMTYKSAIAETGLGGAAARYGGVTPQVAAQQVAEAALASYAPIDSNRFPPT